MAELRFFVAGIPASQGSMKCVGVDRRTGRHMVVPDNPPKLKAWRKAVASVAEWAAKSEGWHPLDVAEVRLIFRFPRPAFHYRTGRNAHLLRSNAPEFPTTAIDVDKATRSIFDSLQSARVVTNDAVIVTVAAAKRYCLLDQPPGVNIVLSSPSSTAQPAALPGLDAVIHTIHSPEPATEGSTI